MAMLSVAYDAIRPLVRPGDVIAFRGDNALSNIVQWAGGAGVSHVGLVTAAETPAQKAQFVEATVRLDGKTPTVTVIETALRDRCTLYDGTVWWLPLARVRPLDEGRLQSFMRGVDGRLFDLGGGIAVVVKGLFQQVAKLPIELTVRLATMNELELYFCSELVAAALQHAGAISGVDPAGASPSDVCRWNIYEPDYSHVHGMARTIAAHNTRAPGEVLGPSPLVLP